MMERVRAEATSEEDLVSIVLEEADRWRKEKPGLWSPSEVTNEAESLAKGNGMKIEDFWYRIRSESN